MNNNSDLEELSELPESLTVLDISDNRIEATDFIELKLAKIKNLRVLYNSGNECVRKIRNYRKFVINVLKHLHYLDDKPVFEERSMYTVSAFFNNIIDESYCLTIYQQHNPWILILLPPD